MALYRLSFFGKTLAWDWSSFFGKGLGGGLIGRLPFGKGLGRGTFLIWQVLPDLSILFAQ